MLKTREIDFLDSNCLEIRFDNVTLIVSLNFGPRILSVTYQQSENLLYVSDETPKDPSEFYFYGGHRLWRAPEDRALTYVPDNNRVHVEISDKQVSFTSPIEVKTQLQKTLIITYGGVDQLEVQHTIKNCADTPQKYASWSITMFKTGGVAIIPLPKSTSHQNQLLPTHQLNLWGYTNLGDERFIFDSEFIGIRQQDGEPLKVGLDYGRGWLAYINAGASFIKQYEYDANAIYPDLGSSLEVFTNAYFLELETLGCLAEVQPQQSASHTERWILKASPTPIPASREALQKLLPSLAEF